MAENAQTMTEFTYAPGETDVIGDRFRPSVVASWLKTSIAVSNTRVQYKAPNTLLGLIQLGETTKAIPLRNIAGIDTNTGFNPGSLVGGLVLLFAGFGTLDSNILAALILLFAAAVALSNTLSASLVFRDPSGGRSAVTVSVFEKDRLMGLSREIEKRVFAAPDAKEPDTTRH